MCTIVPNYVLHLYNNLHTRIWRCTTRSLFTPLRSPSAWSGMLRWGEQQQILVLKVSENYRTEFGAMTPTASSCPLWREINIQVCSYVHDRHKHIEALRPDLHNTSNDTVMGIIILTLKGSPKGLSHFGPDDNCQIQESSCDYNETEGFQWLQ